MLRIGVLCQVPRPKTPMLSPRAGRGEQALSFSRRGFAPELCKTCHVKREAGAERECEGWRLVFSLFATPVSPSPFTFLVTTGLDPVVHAEMQLRKPFGNSKRASPPHGLPDQVRQ